jgi:hypothetical protein
MALFFKRIQILLIYSSLLLSSFFQLVPKFFRNSYKLTSTFQPFATVDNNNFTVYIAEKSETI